MSDKVSSPSRVAGIVAREVSIAGENLVLNQPTKVRTASDEEAVVIGRRTNTVAAVVAACAGLPREEQAAWRRDAIEAFTCGFARDDEWKAYYGSVWPMAFRRWCCLSKESRGDRTLLRGVEWCYNLINDKSVTTEVLDEVALAMRAVSQEDELAK